VAVQILGQQDLFSEVIIGDLNKERARELMEDFNNPKISYVEVNVESSENIQNAIQGCDIVLNCVGPFYKTVKIVLPTVIEAGIHYVDVCDDVDVTLEILELHEQAQRHGITALIGMGSSPGITNILAKFASDQLLDETDSIDIFHAHGGEPHEGPGVIGHRFHCMSIDIPMFLEGELKTVKYFEEDGKALRQTFDFPKLGENIPIYPYPHPEQVTLPKYLKLQQVTNKGTVLPNEYYTLTSELCRMGLSSREPLEVHGHSIAPYDFSIAYLLQERERILKETNFGQQRGCVSVVARGTKEGEPMEYRFHIASKSQALGEGTGIPAAMGVMMIQQGMIDQKGVYPPEGCVDPLGFIGLLSTVIRMGSTEGNAEHETFEGVIIEQIDAEGNLTSINMQDISEWG